MEKKCEWCGKGFTGGQSSKKYCSRKCSNNKWRAANHEKLRKYLVANREKINKRQLELCRANPEKAREKSRKWYAANLEKAREACRKWYAANPEKAREACRKSKQIKEGIMLLEIIGGLEKLKQIGATL